MGTISDIADELNRAGRDAEWWLTQASGGGGHGPNSPGAAPAATNPNAALEEYLAWLREQQGKTDAEKAVLLREAAAGAKNQRDALSARTGYSGAVTVGAAVLRTDTTAMQSIDPNAVERQGGAWTRAQYSSQTEERRMDRERSLYAAFDPTENWRNMWRT